MTGKLGAAPPKSFLLQDRDNNQSPKIPLTPGLTSLTSGQPWFASLPQHAAYNDRKFGFSSAPIDFRAAARRGENVTNKSLYLKKKFCVSSRGAREKIETRLRLLFGHLVVGLQRAGLVGWLVFESGILGYAF